jgi:hypothetical protein
MKTPVLPDQESQEYARSGARRDNTDTGWLGKFDGELQLPAEITALITSAMDDLSVRIPSLALININRGDWIEESDVLATKSHNAIYLNESRWRDVNFWANYKKDWDGCMVDPTPYGVIVHEAGHILDGQLLNTLGSKKYNTFLKSYIDDPSNISGEYVSAYGQENIFEFMAESFSCYFFQRCAQPTPFNDFQLENATRLWDKALDIIENPEISKTNKLRPK